MFNSANREPLYLINWYCDLLPFIEDAVARKGLVGAGWLLAPVTCKNWCTATPMLNAGLTHVI